MTEKNTQIQKNKNIKITAKRLKTAFTRQRLCNREDLQIKPGICICAQAGRQQQMSGLIGKSKQKTWRVLFLKSLICHIATCRYFSNQTQKTLAQAASAAKKRLHDPAFPPSKASIAPYCPQLAASDHHAHVLE